MKLFRTIEAVADGNYNVGDVITLSKITPLYGV